MGNIRQNLFFAFVYNRFGAPVLLSPVIAAAARRSVIHLLERTAT